MKTLLQQLIETNPGLAAEVEALKADQFTKGQQSGANRVEARNKRVLPFLRSDSCYPAAIRDFGCQVLAGTLDYAAFEGSIVLYDQQAAASASQAAQAETEAFGETPAGTGGAFSNEEDELKAQIRSGRNRLGLTN